ncbi:hypothetical protein M0802_015811 [Mischocyttarus mexicanus]|nr:hypothetical protein M0802_015811 [Mischocyttarus mexicanus]
MYQAISHSSTQYQRVSLEPCAQVFNTLEITPNNSSLLQVHLKIKTTTQRLACSRTHCSRHRNGSHLLGEGYATSLLSRRVEGTQKEFSAILISPLQSTHGLHRSRRCHPSRRTP